MEGRKKREGEVEGGMSREGEVEGWKRRGGMSSLFPASSFCRL